MNRDFLHWRRPCPSGAAVQARAGNRSRGVALVVTLIMLAVITVITITMLAIVRRDRTAVTNAHNLTDARLAADAAIERAKADVLSQMMSGTNLMSFGLTVSQSNPTNNSTNLFDPRVPVIPRVPISAAETNTEYGRFFLDLNRNGLYDDSRIVLGDFYSPDRKLRIGGDPEWIGLLEKPYRKHDGNNRFIGRYAYLVVPCGKTLDVNFIHNLGPGGSGGFFRDQGFGPWEINLAAFLADLNTNKWDYSYKTPSVGVLSPILYGSSFQDAKDLVLYRYAAPDARLLPSIRDLYGPVAADAFNSDLIDGYSAAAVPQAMGLTYPTVDPDNANKPWAGADSVRHFFGHQDFLDRAKMLYGRPAATTVTFTDHLNEIGSLSDPYNSSTFYRLLGQLGTDSAEQDLTGKIHLNYVNGPVHTNLLKKIQALFPSVPSPLPGNTNEYATVGSTNFVPWDLKELPELSVLFFTSTAERLFKQQFRQFNPGWDPNPALSITNISCVTNIPVSPTNEYTPALHRLLQQAANIFDATRTNPYPSVFRPEFSMVTNLGPGSLRRVSLCITGFTCDNRRTTLDTWLRLNRTNGIPLVIGAKKGLPNFNEFTLQTDIQVTRKLQFYRPDTNSSPTLTNQLYILGISNLFAVEAWNSYLAAYPRSLKLEVTDQASVTISNAAVVVKHVDIPLVGTATNLPARAWLGKRFLIPINTRCIVLSNSVYQFDTATFVPVGSDNRFEKGFPIPEWTVVVSNDVQYVLSEPDADRIIDFVISRDAGTTVDVDLALMQTKQMVGVTGTRESAMVSQMWNTNRYRGGPAPATPTEGIVLQIGASMDAPSAPDDVWKNYMDDALRGMDRTKAVAAFQRFMDPEALTTGNQPLPMAGLVMGAPLCPTRKMVRTSTWQVNDPLVHYHFGDLMIYPTNSLDEFMVPPTVPLTTNTTLSSIGRVNRCYDPWGGNPDLGGDVLSPTQGTDYDLTIKDPGVRSSDDWDFPNGKFPGIGWLGRVHRGTPWQTVYFKHTEPEATSITWVRQSSEYIWAPDYWFRAHPTNDWAMADMFTVATDPNSTRGLLSINQENLAAWSAVLSGVAILRNPLPDEKLMSISTNGPIPLEADFVQPAMGDPTSPLARFVDGDDGLNKYRQTLPNAAFSSLAEFLQVPAFTVRSPWLNWKSDFQQKKGLTDSAYERLPQQLLSLLKAGDSRFVVYAYGQSLKPADNSLDSANGNVCTNYQVTAEMATRAVIRVEGPPDKPRAVIESFNILPPD